MPKGFTIPSMYSSSLIRKIKRSRTEKDPKRKDFSPTKIELSSVIIHLARHFGFCYGVENAIEIAWKAIEENPNKNIYLLSEMIHNPDVNKDLEENGIKFIMDTKGNLLIDFEKLDQEDIIIIPAFGTTREIFARLKEKKINTLKYDTTCPFVKKVWKRSNELGRNGFSVIVHGKRKHEETRATFSHSSKLAKTIIVRDMDDVEELIAVMHGKRTREEFFSFFAPAISPGFDPQIHLKKIGVINQTTMLARETKAIAQKIKKGLIEIYGEENISQHFANTKDTLCYATNENQTAAIELIRNGGDLGIIIGGYNSSNTSHLYELCSKRMITYYIKNSSEILDKKLINHFIPSTGKMIQTADWATTPRIDSHKPLVAITAGASCPDSTINGVLHTIAKCFDCKEDLDNYESSVEK